MLLRSDLLADIESILDEALFISHGGIALQANVDEIREQKGESVDAFFREVFKC